jgi:hypothetical protein
MGNFKMNPSNRSMLLFTLFFFLFYLVVSLINQTLLGNNPTITLFQNLCAGSVIGLIAFKAWRIYKKALDSIPKDKIVHTMEPWTGVTVIAFLAFTTILGGLNRYHDMGLANILTVLSLGPVVVGFVSGNIPISFWKKKRD